MNKYQPSTNINKYEQRRNIETYINKYQRFKNINT